MSLIENIGIERARGLESKSSPCPYGNIEYNKRDS